MKSKLVSTAAFCALIALTGCAGGVKPMAFDNQKSEAMNVVAAAYGWGTAERFYRDAPPEATHNTEKAIGVGAAGVAANTLPGVSLSATSIGVGMVSSLLSAPNNPAVGTGVIFWMPAGQAKDGIEARNIATKMVSDALAETMNKFGFEGVSVTTRETWPSNIHHEFYVKGHTCKNLHPEWGPLSVVSVNGKELEQVKAPSWLGGQDAWGIGAGIFINSCAKPGINLIALYQDLSSRLPDWAYVQVGATNTRGPILFHQGKELRFITPQ